MHKTCFVIQRFDGSVYDRRYRETFAPAIEVGGAKPMRADEVLGTTPVIEKIEAGLRNATIALAEVSEDNPNVFLEMGYALALNVPTIIVCDKAKRLRLPFDISHRPVLFYSTESQSDFERLSKDISENVRVAISEAMTKSSSVPPSPISSDLDFVQEDVRRACLLEFLDQDLRDPSGSTLWAIQKKVVGPGISERMVALAVSKLIADDFVERSEAFDQDTHESYVALSLTDYGRRELLRSYSTLMRNEQTDLRSGRLLEDQSTPF